MTRSFTLHALNSSKLLNSSSLRQFHSSVLQWYRRHRRLFPWRRTHSPYKILLSEIMLQQTQAHRVVEFYKRWLQKFPTFSALSKASKGKVLREWSGLGYNNRALRFHRLAAIITEQYHSRLPKDVMILQSLPGIGRYTAHAVACFAFQQQVPVVDVNIKRVVTRVTKRVRSSAEMLPEKKAWQLAEKFLSRKHAYEWNQALMDIGALVCTARNPKCGECPLKKICRSAFSSSFSKQVTKNKKKEPSWKGIPRRLYRGKILKLLHQQSMSVQHIASRLWKGKDRNDTAWLNSVLRQMQNDGLISRNNNLFRIAQ